MLPVEDLDHSENCSVESSVAYPADINESKSSKAETPQGQDLAITLESEEDLCAVCLEHEADAVCKRLTEAIV
jgi:hypothetical protein